MRSAVWPGTLVVSGHNCLTRMNIELLREAYAIIDGIPDKRINLGVIARGPKPNDPKHCGTIACAAGWLGMHPKFKELGMRTSNGDLTLKGVPDYFDWDDVLARVFDCSQHVAQKLFEPRRWKETSGKTDKQVWQARVREYLKKRGK